LTAVIIADIKCTTYEEWCVRHKGRWHL